MHMQIIQVMHIDHTHHAHEHTMAAVGRTNASFRGKIQYVLHSEQQLTRHVHIMYTYEYL